ncbi:hypothetical protein B0H67DRAFT_640607 [Lasiosphaeris hirsuta]|uniref:Uncharacterized protein n=1 Tax=Lasiosphaeris hirsuta TaxID=260670 RepID=A0AA40BDT5_9PEZI|nr:hypothetical protein B0H67DRAFT_640607 [Lasiosphaeris hirsuta]
MVSSSLVLAALASHVLLAASAPTSPDLGARATKAEINLVPLTDTEWDDRISCIKNISNKDNKCTWDKGCKGASYDNQEDADLGDGDGRFNEAISSFICVPK